MSISADTLRGHTDTIILAQLLRGDNYGYEINKNIQQLTQGEAMRPACSSRLKAVYRVASFKPYSPWVRC